MSRLFHRSLPDTLGALVGECIGENATLPGAVVEIWTFDSPARRAAAARTLAGHGLPARVRSAYKPVIFAFLEEVSLTGIDAIHVAYPTVHGTPPDRFRRECYPLTELVAPRPVTFTAGPLQDPGRLLTYTVTLTGSAGGEVIQVAAPNAFITDHTGARVLANTGWVRIAAPAAVIRDEAIETEQHQALAQAMAALAAHPWRGQGPHFERLTIEVAAPFYDFSLPIPGRHISTAEAMHEELYFGSLEVLRQAGGLPPDDRTLQPGQIVPRVVSRDGAAEVTITVETPPPPVLETPSPIDLDTATGPPSPAMVKAALDTLGGQPYAAKSRQGRPVWATYIDGAKPGVVISANQHGNETSGIIGALRAAERLRGIAFAVSPLENPDGYALYRDLRAAAPAHMHHAARYTAAGNDLEYAERGYENEVRYWAREKTGAELHLNLHGYPAHEWTRPFTGYLPRGFEQWTIPKGFLLILRAKSGWQTQADRILAAVTGALNADADLVAFNERQIARYRQYVPGADLALHGAIPVFKSTARDDALFPIALITEAPDEGATGADYALFHTAHMRAVLAAAQAI